MRKQIIKQILDEFSLLPITYDVYIIANTREKTIEQSPHSIHHASLDEFFSRTEFAEIASAIFDIFGYAKVFYSELDFMEYILEHNIKYDECIIYNLARDGRHAGKKSLIPAICDLLGLRYTGSNAFVISLLRNKFIYNSFLLQYGIPVPQSWLITVNGHFPYGEPPENKKIIVKNIQESASIGLTENNIFIYTHSPKTKKKLIDCCFSMKCHQALVQEFISGMECEVLVIKYKNSYIALDPVAINIRNGEILSSSISNSYQYSFSALESYLPSIFCQQICKFAEQAARLLDIKTYARFDFRIDSNMNCFLIDIAGTPYTIRHSSIAYLFQEMYDLAYKDIYKVIVFLTLLEYQK